MSTSSAFTRAALPYIVAAGALLVAAGLATALPARDRTAGRSTRFCSGIWLTFHFQAKKPACLQIADTTKLKFPMISFIVVSLAVLCFAFSIWNTPHVLFLPV